MQTKVQTNWPNNFNVAKKKKIRINIDSFIRIIKSRVSLDKFESTQRAHIIAKAIVNKN